MIDLDLLKKKGLTDDNLRKWLTVDPTTIAGAAGAGDKIAALIFRIRSRIQEGMDRNFRDFRLYYALDLAWDTPFRQVTPTLVQSFLNSDPNNDEVYKAIQDWGLNYLIEEKTDPKTSKTIKVFNFPTFFNVLIPLVRAYVTIRWAKIVNDRMLTPFMKYEPVKNTAVLGAKCEVLTDRIQVMANQYGWFDVLKQSVLKMLHYSVAFQIPKEEWHSEAQWKIADEQDVALQKKKEDGSPVNAGDEIRVTTREGLRYHQPVPTRFFRDMAHPAYTYNYDSGCEYAGYWRICRYREIVNAGFWNTDKVTYGVTDPINANRLFFNTVYTACTMAMPVQQTSKQVDGPVLAAEVGLGGGTLDRERELANQYYGTEHGDQGVLVTEYYEKLVPKDNGLGDYDCPVWFRFVVAGDGATILYAAPLPYCPIVYYGYDADESRSTNASLSLECLPFQDTFSNVMTQIILTAKQNLANLTFVDEDQIDETTKRKLQNIGEQTFRFLNIFGYSSKRAARYQQRVADAVQSATLPKGNVAELIAVLRQILDVLERVLVMSSQEVAQAASHELRAEEVRNIQGATSSRLTFTATPVDIAMDAWKRQAYAGLMAYGDDDMWGHIPSDTPLTKEQLEAMGFTFVDKDSPRVNERFVSVRTTKQKTAVPLWEFASTRDGRDRADNVALAQGLSVIVQNLLNNPITAQAIGADQAIDLTNLIMRLAGMPRDLKLRNTTPAPSPEEQQAAAQQQLQEVIKAVIPAVDEHLKNELDPLLKENAQQSKEIALIFRALGLNLNLNPSNDNSPTTPAPGPGIQSNPGLAAPAGMPPIPAVPA